jgi:hypothetical protein
MTMTLEGLGTCKVEPVFLYPERKNKSTVKGEKTVFFAQRAGLRRL